MSAAFHVDTFSAADDTNFVSILSDPKYPAPKVRAHSQASYLYGYLKDLGALTMLVEYEYTDGDYLEDYAAYYATCFESYSRRCKRVHFFKSAFDAADVEALLRREAGAKLTPEALNFSYLGFVVVRPLPVALIGRTLLKTYPGRKTSPDGSREYSVLVDHEVHLFGMVLMVRSLPFQEQDHAVAACATVALWSAFHKTAELFRTPIPRPPRITSDATRGVISGRSLPSSGLSLEQMAEAIRMNGLDPEVLTIDPAKPLAVPIVSYISAYLSMGLPIIVGIEIQTHGLHAVTITGCSRLDNQALDQEIAPTKNGRPNPQVPTTARRIDEFYAHDDGTGPHSRLRIVFPTADLPPDGRRVDGDSLQFEGGWNRQDDAGTKARMSPHVIVVPVYRKIRLSFNDVYDRVLFLHYIANAAALGHFVDWDISLITSNDYKDKVFAKPLPVKMRTELLVRPQPRFIWRAVIRVAGAEAVELLADATGFDQSFPFFAAHYFDMSFGERLTQMLQVSSGIVKHLSPELRDFLVTAHKDQSADSKNSEK